MLIGLHNQKNFLSFFKKYNQEVKVVNIGTVLQVGDGILTYLWHYSNFFGKRADVY